MTDRSRVSHVHRALEGTWRAIQRLHPEVPRVAIYIASGEGLKYGHFGPGERWIERSDDGERVGLPEVLIAGEGLARGGRLTFGTLLHEAVHASNAAQGIRDYSRGGRYHNTKFKDRAEAMGLDVHQLPPYGWARTTLPDATAETYAEQLADLEDAIGVYMRDLHKTGVYGQDDDEREREGDGDGDGEGEGEPEKPKSRHLKAECTCGRKIRASRSVLEAGPILCALCGDPFTAAD